MLIFLKIGHHFQSPRVTQEHHWGDAQAAWLADTAAVSLSLLRIEVSQGWGTAYIFPVITSVGKFTGLQTQSVFNKEMYSSEFLC